MKKAINICVNILAWILVVVAAMMTIMVFASQGKDGIPNLFGKYVLSIQSNSMSPVFNEGDIIISDKVTDVENLKVGDIISFNTTIEGQRTINTHRIIEIKNNGGIYSFVTKGEANAINDIESVYQVDIISKYSGIRIVGIGKVFDFLNTQNGFLICIVVPLIAFFLYELYRFINVIVSSKKTKLTAEQEEEIKRKAIEEYLSKQNEQSEQSEQSEEPISQNEQNV